MLITIPLDCPRQAICPNCASPLDARNMTFAHNVAFCVDCTQTDLFRETRYRQALYLRHVVASSHRFQARGLTLYAPRIKPLYPIDSFEAIWDPDFIYLDASGNAAPLPPCGGSIMDNINKAERLTPLDNLNSPLP